MRRPWALSVISFSSLLSGCVTHYTTVAEVPAGQSALLQNIENYYLAKAKEQAAFLGPGQDSELYCRKTESTPAEG